LAGMNCFSRPVPARRAAAAGRLLVIALAAAGCGTQATAADPERVYDVRYTVTPEPDQGTATVELALSQPRSFLREVSMTMPGARYSAIEGDGEIHREGQRVTWLPPADGGRLAWTVRVSHLRYGEAHDAWLGRDWALFRGTDLMPAARTRTLKGSVSRTSLAFVLPRGWSSLTQYRERDGVYPVTNAERRFDRPTGWMLLGRIGVRYETIAGVRTLVGGPTGQDVRRMDMLAFMNWTLPRLTRLLPDFPKRLTVVSADGSMWRGGLSGPRSLYVHASLPLISENGTSTLLHELMHIGMGLDSADGADWIIEGLAEYYALEVLRRSRTITRRRYDEALEDQAEWSRDAESLCAGESTAATTARAVTVFAALHRQLAAGANGSDTLDDLLRGLVDADRKVTVARLRSLATDIHGSLPESLSPRNLPGCS